MHMKHTAVIFLTLCLLSSIASTALPSAAQSEIRAGPEKEIYLTFDDGPTDSTTPYILDILKEKNIPATFFVIGRQIKGREKIIRRMAEDRHSIGIHSYSHVYREIYASESALLQDIAACRRAIQEVLQDYSATIYRFPGGSSLRPDLRGTVTGAGYRYYDWNAATGDAEANYTAERLYQNAVETSKGKRRVILLMHDGVGYRETIRALPDIIAYFRENGYTFRTL